MKNNTRNEMTVEARIEKLNELIGKFKPRGAKPEPNQQFVSWTMPMETWPQPKGFGLAGNCESEEADAPGSSAGLIKEFIMDSFQRKTYNHLQSYVIEKNRDAVLNSQIVNLGAFINLAKRNQATPFMASLIGTPVLFFSWVSRDQYGLLNAATGEYMEIGTSLQEMAGIVADDGLNVLPVSDIGHNEAVRTVTISALSHNLSSKEEYAYVDDDGEISIESLKKLSLVVQHKDDSSFSMFFANGDGRREALAGPSSNIFRGSRCLPSIASSKSGCPGNRY